MRLSTFPTLHGEKAVVRLFAASGRYLRLDDLGLPAEVREALGRLLGETSGAILFSRPAGQRQDDHALRLPPRAGRRHRGPAQPGDAGRPDRGGRRRASPQSQVNPAAGFDLETGLRSLLRQDPEVIAVGEIRDRATAEVAFQASLTGHLVLTTFHAGSAAGVVGRLSDMGIEPYLLRSGLLAVVCAAPGPQALRPAPARSDDPRPGSACPSRAPASPSAATPAAGPATAAGCVLAEMLVPDRAANSGRAILARTDVARLERSPSAPGMVTRWHRACRRRRGRPDLPRRGPPRPRLLRPSCRRFLLLTLNTDPSASLSSPTTDPWPLTPTSHTAHSTRLTP